MCPPCCSRPSASLSPSASSPQPLHQHPGPAGRSLQASHGGRRQGPWGREGRAPTEPQVPSDSARGRECHFFQAHSWVPPFRPRHQVISTEAKSKQAPSPLQPLQPRPPQTRPLWQATRLLATPSNLASCLGQGPAPLPREPVSCPGVTCPPGEMAHPVWLLTSNLHCRASPRHCPHCSVSWGTLTP